MKTSIYLDNAATTKTAQEVVDAMLPYFTENYGNPSSIYDLGTKSKEAITKGREQIAEVLGAKSEEIYFTAGGSEADNWALKATFEAYKNKGNHIITTKIEHHAILHTCEYLEKRGAKITYLDVDENGVVTGVAKGETTITVTLGDETVEVKVIVTDESTNPTESFNPDDLMYGDANVDETVDSADIVVLNKYLINSVDYPLKDAQAYEQAQTVYDDEIDTKDAVAIINYVLGLIDMDDLGPAR